MSRFNAVSLVSPHRSRRLCPPAALINALNRASASCPSDRACSSPLNATFVCALRRPPRFRDRLPRCRQIRHSRYRTETPGWVESSANRRRSKGMRRFAGILLVGLMVPACAARSTGPRSTPSPRRVIETRQGLASYYADSFHGKTTASGVRFDTKAMVAAHPKYPFGTRVRVTSLATRRSVQVLIVDRGPARGPRAQGVIIDLSRAAAERLGFLRAGRTTVRVEVLSWPTRRDGRS